MLPVTSLTPRRALPVVVRRFALLVVVALGGLALASPAHAAPSQWDIDGVHSGVDFSVRHFFSQVHGSFEKFSGRILFDEGAPGNSSVELTIDAASVNTANEKRDGHLRSADFFNVEKFPTLTFKSTRVETTENPSVYQITGDFTMLGVTKPVTVMAELLGVGPDGSGGTRAGFSVTGMLNRKDFGMVWNKVLDTGGTMLSDEVNFQVSLSLAKKAS